MVFGFAFVAISDGEDSSLAGEETVSKRKSASCFRGSMEKTARKPEEWPTAMSVCESQHMDVAMLPLNGRRLMAA